MQSLTAFTPAAPLVSLPAGHWSHVCPYAEMTEEVGGFHASYLPAGLEYSPEEQFTQSLMDTPVAGVVLPSGQLMHPEALMLIPE